VLLRRPGPVNPDELILQRWAISQRLVDASGQPENVGISRADDDARMGQHSAMKTDEMPTVECQYASTLGSRKLKNLLVRRLLVRLTGFLCGKNIVPELTQPNDRRVTEVLVGVQSRHR
jgi:hypothetical protein